MTRAAPITVVEMPEFLSVSRKFMDEAERSPLVLYLAYNPEAGEIIRAPADFESCDGHLKGAANEAAQG